MSIAREKERAVGGTCANYQSQYDNWKMIVGNGFRMSCQSAECLVASMMLALPCIPSAQMASKRTIWW